MGCLGVLPVDILVEESVPAYFTVAICVLETRKWRRSLHSVAIRRHRRLVVRGRVAHGCLLYFERRCSIVLADGARDRGQTKDLDILLVLPRKQCILALQRLVVL